MPHNEPQLPSIPRVAGLFSLGLAAFGVLIFVPAGTLMYWQAWVYMAVIFLPALITSVYLMKRSPELVLLRLRYREKEPRQRLIIRIGTPLFALGFIIAGIDHRFGWSEVPTWLVLIGDLLVLTGYGLVFTTLKQNPFAARTIEIFPGQRLVDSGLYALVRHPMYMGMLPLYLGTPLALGSYWAFPLFALACSILIPRIQNEEAVLHQGLPGYTAYCQRVRYRLIPYLW